jgi:hypothetical protein
MIRPVRQLEVDIAKVYHFKHDRYGLLRWSGETYRARVAAGGFPGAKGLPGARQSMGVPTRQERLMPGRIEDYAIVGDTRTVGLVDRSQGPYHRGVPPLRNRHAGPANSVRDVNGERRLTEIELDSLPGYQGSRPVRIGNKASTQFQLDVFGEVLDSALTAAQNALPGEVGWDPGLLLAILDHLETVWQEPDNGIWEVRGPRRHFTHSKVMAWVAFRPGRPAGGRIPHPAR